MKIFKFRESLKHAWGIYKKNWKLVLSALAAYAGILAFLSSMDSLPMPLITGIIWTIISTTLSIYISFVISRGTLKLYDTHHVDKDILFFTQKQVVTIIKALVILAGLGIIFVGAFLLLSVSSALLIGLLGIIVGIIIILIGLYVMLRLSFSTFFLIDHASHMGGRAIVKDLWSKTKGKVGTIITFGVKIFLLNLLGFVALGIGLIITIPLSAIMQAQFYRDQIQEKA
jgi:hypothetical protein